MSTKPKFFLLDAGQSAFLNDLTGNTAGKRLISGCQKGAVGAYRAKEWHDPLLFQSITKKYP